MGRKKSPGTKRGAGATAAGHKTVGVYDRPPPKGHRKPLLIAVIVALALLITLIVVRLSQGSPATAAGGRHLSASLVPVSTAYGFSGGTNRSEAVCSPLATSGMIPIRT